MTWYNRLLWLGSRGCTIRNAIPLVAGSASSSFLQASSPPAEAPIAAIGKSARRPASSGLRIQRGRAGLGDCARPSDISILSRGAKLLSVGLSLIGNYGRDIDQARASQSKQEFDVLA